MKIKDVREAYYFYSGKASDVARQLAFAGIAVVWIFKVEATPTSVALPPELFKPLIAFVVTLLLDALQYAAGTLIWGIRSRLCEKERMDPDKEFTVSAYLNWPALTCFCGKMVAILIGFALLADQLRAIARFAAG